MYLSVLMSVYFKEKPEYLEACLKSLLNQTLPADEVVLVEDGVISTDLHSVIDKYRESLNIISIPLPKNVGLACALNVGLRHCENDLVARMDTFDIAIADRFEKQVAFMQAFPDISVSSGYIEEFNDAGKVLSKRVLPLTHDELVKFSKMRSPLSHPAVIFRKNAVVQVGGYPDLYPEDYLLWIKLMQNNNKIANIPEIILKMRTGEGFISRRGWRFLLGELKVYKYMFETKFINRFELLKIVILKSILRLSPGFLKIVFYRFGRCK